MGMATNEVAYKRHLIYGLRRRNSLESGLARAPQNASGRDSEAFGLSTILQLTGVSKSYGGVAALQAVDRELYEAAAVRR